MRLSIHQPEYLPWLGFFDKMRRVDRFVLLDTVQFTKEDFQNRNRIKTRDGWAWLSVPVYKTGRMGQSILDVEICNDSKWGKKTWGQLLQNYNKAPFFKEHRTFFESLYQAQHVSLCELNIAIIEALRKRFGLETELARASKLEITVEDPSGYLAAICEAHGATEYLSGTMGREYLDLEPFERAGVKVTFHEFHHPQYEQLFFGFEPRMSSVDLLFNHGPGSLGILQGAAP